MNTQTVAQAADPARRPLPDDFVARLQRRFEERFSQADSVCLQHGRDESPFAPMPPDAVVFAQSTEDVVAVVQACAEFDVPVIAWGAGSSLEGHVLAVRGGIVLDLSGMNQILDVHAEDQTATVQAGVTREQLNDHLRDSGLFFPIDPGANATLGGMAATRASGTNAVRYGTMRENVLNLEVVTAQGEVVRTARRARKSSAGYDLTSIFVGSEGTLGIITQVTVRLHPRPQAESAAICHFPDVHHAVASVIEVIQSGVPIARVELMDEAAVRATNRYSQMTFPEQPLLLFEFHGTPASVREQAQWVQEIATAHQGRDFEWAHRPEERSRLWAARHQAFFAGLALRPGSKASTTDVCVPISRLADCMARTRELLASASFPTTILGHVGDGNFHVMMLLDPDNPQEWEQAEQLNAAMVQIALDAQGTCTGEHGIGLHKRQFMPLEFDAGALRLMQALKTAYDPADIFNPGKVLPAKID